MSIDGPSRAGEYIGSEFGWDFRVTLPSPVRVASRSQRGTQWALLDVAIAGLEFQLIEASVGVMWPSPVEACIAIDAPQILKSSVQIHIARVHDGRSAITGRRLTGPSRGI